LSFLFIFSSLLRLSGFFKGVFAFFFVGSEIQSYFKDEQNK
jgi:hypothetical protein